MKLAISILFLALTLIGKSSAQEGFGYLNFVNLIPGEKSCQIRINSKNPAASGLSSGSSTGWFLFQPGSCSLSVNMEGHRELKTDFNVQDSVGAIIAIYSETDGKILENGEPSPPALRIKSFPTYQSHGRALRFVSLCKEGNRFQLGPIKIEVDRFAITEIPNWTGAGFELKKNSNPIKNITAIKEHEPFYLLVGSGTNGDSTAAIIFAGTPGTPAWRKPKKPENKK